MKKLLMMTALISGISSPVALADSDFYLGGSVGQATVDYPSGAGFIVTDDSDTSWKVFAGYNVNPNFAVELAYQDLGESEAAVGDIPLYFGGDTVSLSLIGKLPLGDKAEVFAKFGYVHLDADIHSPGFDTFADNESDFLYGLGVSYQVAESVDVRMELERMNFADQVDTVSLGVSYNFK